MFIIAYRDSGLGKTTFINTLFNAPLNDENGPKHLASAKTVAITPITYELVEENVTLHLTVVDTPGFGDTLNRETNFDPIMKYIDAQYENYLQAERSDEKRGKILDTRIHALLYFLPPYGAGLRDIDIEFMQRFCTKVNIIPVIGKSDALMADEAVLYKRTVLKDLTRHDIRIYPLYHAEDRDHIVRYEKYMPFCVIGSDDFIEKPGGRKVRARKYGWGAVEVENEAHCDFIHLREMLIRTNMQDLIDTTHSVHYSLYRGVKMGASITDSANSPAMAEEVFDGQIQNARAALVEEMRLREDEIKKQFVVKVREKEADLRNREEALNAKRIAMMEEIEAMRAQMA
ncbi:Septin-6 [Entophlyctis luteolus]|nr:Septin-6 [Entophlyctis luteolus]KAJ3388616.1 Septin-6 [Entophlyctis sp. JEL0112]